MTTSIRSVVRGLRVALATPSHIDHRLPGLMTLAPDSGRPVSDPSVAIAAAHRVLRILARIPGSPWRNTCLYRSVTACVLLRAHGVAARLCLGVDHRLGSNPHLEAHAWVETGADVVAPTSAPPRPSIVRLVGSRRVLCP